MAGTLEGGRAAAETNKSKYGPDYYARIGQLGGRLGKTGGFASTKVDSEGLTGRQRAIVYGKIGGTISRRTKKQYDTVGKGNR